MSNLISFIAVVITLVYFVYETLLQGLESNLHFLILIICLLAIALFESMLV